MPEFLQIDPSSVPDWALWLVLAGWLIDKILAYIKWRAEKRNSTDPHSRGLELQRQSDVIDDAARELHDMSVIIQARDHEGKPLVWSAKTPILQSVDSILDDIKEVKKLVKTNYNCIQAIEHKLNVNCKPFHERHVRTDDI